MRWVLVVLLLLTACAGEETTRSPAIPDPVEDVPVVTQPVEVTLDVPRSGEHPYREVAQCAATGGKPPYTITWTLSGQSLPCVSTECPLTLGVGEYVVTCEVTDSARIREGTSTSVIVERRRVAVDQVVVFGDSLSYGEGLAAPQESSWSALLAASFDDASRANYAEAGATSDGVLAQVAGRKPVEGEALVFVWVGANDAKYLVPQETFAVNYRAIIETVKDDGRLVLLTVPDASKLSVADEIEGGVNDFLGQFGVAVDVKGLTQEVIRSYNAVIVSLGEEYGLVVIDMFTYLGAFDDALITADRFHPNEAGHALIEKQVMIALEEAYPEEVFV